MSEHPQGLDDRLRKLGDLIPGYRGYRERDARRTADRALRDRIGARLHDGTEQLVELSAQLVRKLALDHITEVDRMVSRSRASRASVEHADYGFSGLFDAEHINEERLAEVHAHDLTLLESAEAVVAASAKAAAEDADLEAALRDVATAIAAFDARLTERRYVMDGSRDA